jgi:hypothetical protein
VDRGIQLKNITITLEEEERQMTLLALAKLAVERPGWVWALEQIALKMDNRVDEDRAEMFRKFLSLHGSPEGRTTA